MSWCRQFLLAGGPDGLVHAWAAPANTEPPAAGAPSTTGVLEAPLASIPVCSSFVPGSVGNASAAFVHAVAFNPRHLLLAAVSAFTYSADSLTAPVPGSGSAPPPVPLPQNATLGVELNLLLPPRATIGLTP